MSILKLSSDDKETVSPDILASYIETLSLHRGQHYESMPKELVHLIDNLPPRAYVASRMDRVERELLMQTVGHIWKKVTGNNIRSVDTRIATTDSHRLDGTYWMVPGGILIRGFNHFSAAKNHRDLLCGILGINGFVFEATVLEKDPHGLINLVLSHGGIRVAINREKSAVYMQTTEGSWPWARDKLKKMWHKHKVARVIDRRQPYRGWKSGVPVIVK
jgi:hypothetical protein